MSAEAQASWASLAAHLRADSPIAVLEQFERQLKEMLTRELTAAPDGVRIRALASFQRELGFLLKYKSCRAAMSSCVISMRGARSTGATRFSHG